MSRPVGLLAAVLLGLLLATGSYAQDGAAEGQITNLDQLLDSVRQAQQQQRALNAQREREFLQDNRRQKELMAQARRDFERRQQQNQPLLAVTESNKSEIPAWRRS